MRVQITFDENNYITRINGDINGNYDVSDDFEFEYCTCYHLVNDKLILDEAKKQEVVTEDNNREEIATLQKDLDDTDYIISRCFEEIMALDNKLTFITDMIAILVKYSKQYKDVLKSRKDWRERIAELKK